MNEYNFSIRPAVGLIQPVTLEEADALAHGFLKVVGLEEVWLEPWLHIHFIAVFRFSGTQARSGRHGTGWVVGGRTPHLELSDAEIQNPVEALAIYALYERTWLDAKGVPDVEGTVPVYRVPPDWGPLSFSPGFEEWRLGAVTNLIAWNLIPNNEQEVIHPDIREKCIRRGWLR